MLFGSRLFLLGFDCPLAGLRLRPLSACATKVGFLAVATRFNSLRFKPAFLSLPACQEKPDQDQDYYDYQDNDETGAHRSSSLGAANISPTEAPSDRDLRIHALERRQRVAGSPAEVFSFFADAYNLEKITPPWLRFKVRSRPLEMAAGAEIRYSLRLHGMPIRWVSRIDVWEPPHRFVDVQVHGPYRLWHHTHSLQPAGDHVLMLDAVRYALPFGPLGELLHRTLVRHDLERIFDYRREAIDRSFDSPS